MTKGYILDWAVIDCVTVMGMVERTFEDVVCSFHDIDEDNYEIVVMGEFNVAKLENLLARYI